MAAIDPTKSTELPVFDHRVLDLRGMRFERLVVSSFAGRDSMNRILWHCTCDCGNTTIAASFALRNKAIRNRKRSCGCLASDVTRSRSLTHGKTTSMEYASWKSMIQRCTNPNANGFYRYGGRGISICESWLNSFESFIDDMGHRPTPDHELDRIDNDGNYEPSNCRWATRKEQANNRRKRHDPIIEFGGLRLTVKEWAERLGIRAGTIHHRRWQRWPVEKVLAPNSRPELKRK